MKKEISLILCTVPDVKVGRKMADVLLKQKLAACISIMPKIESHYVWKGKKEKAGEVLLIIKTAKNRYKSLEKVILANHPYECPEILQINIGQGFKGYLKWVLDAVSVK